MSFVFINNYSSTINAASSTATTLTVANSTGLPTLTTGEMMPLTLKDAATGTFFEIVYVTAISGANLTVLRAQEGTSALNWSTGDLCYVAPTAQTVTPVSGSSIYATLAELVASSGATLIGWIRSATGAVFRYLADKLSDTIDGRDFGVKADGVYFTGSATAASSTITSNTAVFASTDVGKTIRVRGAGASGASLITTIATYISTTQVTGTASASTTVTNVSSFFGTDDTAAIQATLTAAGNGERVRFHKGVSLVSATITADQNQKIIGDGPNSTKWQRYGNYGDTLIFANAGAVTIEGLWIQHSDQYVAGDTALADLATSGAHINFANDQGTIMRDVWLWRMPYGVEIQQGALFTFDHCNMQGTWDYANTPVQEGIASIAIGTVAYTQIVKIEKCYFGGSGSAARSVTYTSSDTGAHTFSIVENIGSQFGILINRCEDFSFINNYIGGNDFYNIYADLASGGTNLDWRINDNFIDSARTSMLYFTTQANGTLIDGVSVTGNVFNGEENCVNGLVIYNPLGTSPCVTNLSVSGNTSQATVGTFGIIYSASNANIGPNTITGYNCRNVTAGGDANFSSAFYAGNNTSHTKFTSNELGGNVNGAALPSYCYQGVTIAAGLTNVLEKGTFWIGAGAGGAQYGRVDHPVTALSHGNYSMSGSEDVIAVSNSTGAMQVTLPTNVPPGYCFWIKDVAGNAATYPTQMVGTIDGALNPVYSTNYFSHNLLWNGSVWSQMV